MTSKYSTLTNILDNIILEAPDNLSKKYPTVTLNQEHQNQARSRAFIHLYLKVSFGILLFEDREHLITDGTYDGGIDGYYINTDTKTVFLIQSKFRTNDKNFENKEIELAEILNMDIDRILEGETLDEFGNEYNGKIKQLQRELSTTEGIARYSYRVIILANLSNFRPSDLRKLCAGLACEVFNFESCYEKLVFPIITGTFFTASELSINIDLSNKNAGSKISYTVQTHKGKCEITVLFVPIVELGRIMHKYKNSILKYNPRSYLSLEGKSVNNAIRKTVIESDTNEFALFNNGITMISDETFINEKIGQKHKAQLIVKNPQIINGGQTTYTLSQIFGEYSLTDAEEIFQNKEVLIKIITLQDNNELDNKLELINAISEATNKQTPVINADRFSNEKLQIQLQKILFDRYNLLYERKRGEFADGVYNSYITENSIVERNFFYRIFFASNGILGKAIEKKLFFQQDLNEEDLTTDNLDNSFFGIHCIKEIVNINDKSYKILLTDYAKLYCMILLLKPEKIEDYADQAKKYHSFIKPKWDDFLNFYKAKFVAQKNKKNKLTGELTTYDSSNYGKWFTSKEFNDDVYSFFK